MQLVAAHSIYALIMFNLECLETNCVCERAHFQTNEKFAIEFRKIVRGTSTKIYLNFYGHSAIRSKASKLNCKWNH